MIKNRYFELGSLKNICIVILFAAMFLMTSMKLKLGMNEWVVDEYHSIYITSQKVFSKNGDSRVLGASRWLLRISYPVATYYMTMRMGGEHMLTGWEYPGHKYIIEHLKPSGEGFKNDPNLQNYVYIQRLANNTYFILSVCVLFAVLYSNISPISSLVYFGFLLGSYRLGTEMSYAYADLFMCSNINFLVALILMGKKNMRNLFLITLIIATMASTKINGIIMAIPGFLFLYKLKLDREVYIKLLRWFLISLIILNIYELVSLNSFFHYFFANLYHYNTGHLVTEPSGFYQFSRGLMDVGYIQCLIGACLIPFAFTNRMGRYRLLNIGILSSISLLFLMYSGVRIFTARNYLSIFILISIFSAINIGIFFKERKLLQEKLAIFSLGAYLIYVIYVNLSYDPLQAWKGSLDQCNKIGLIGQNYLGRFEKVESIPNHYNLTEDMAHFESNLKDYDCVVAKTNENDKTYTNFILPRHYKLVERYGDLFYYKK